MDDFIIELEDIIPSRLCREIIERFEKDDRKGPGITGSGLLEDIKKSTDLVISGLMEWDDINKKLSRVLNYVFITHYTAHINKIPHAQKWWSDIGGSRGHITGFSGFQVQRTEKGQYYEWHDDSGDDRYLTYIFYLNTLEDEDGGQTEFHNGRKVKPKEGKLLIFPATWTYPHRGLEVTGKTKYIATGWFANRDRDKLASY